MVLNKLTYGDQKLLDRMAWLKEWETFRLFELLSSQKDAYDTGRKLMHDENLFNTEDVVIPQELKDFREQMIRNKHLEPELVEKMNKIDISIENDNDGNKIIIMKLWSKTYKFLCPNLKNYSDDEYYDDKKNYIKYWWMKEKDIDEWENEKLKKFLQQKEKEWFHMPELPEIEEILIILGVIFSKYEERSKILVLEYLTWMNREYWIKKWSLGMTSLLMYYKKFWDSYYKYKDYDSNDVFLISNS